MLNKQSEDVGCVWELNAPESVKKASSAAKKRFSFCFSKKLKRYHENKE